MSKEKLLSLTKYQAEIKSKLESKDVPAKHQGPGKEKTYRTFLNNELRVVTNKIEALKIAGAK